ncbi:MAG: hypothetical protein HQL31_04945 [Planctomycetes bacterium]|nr:hypothetical protein [Planctomycetota bacterium]
MESKVCYMLTAALLVISGALFAAEAEKAPPPPPWKVPGYPILGMRSGAQPPVLDGKVDLDKEWRDACVLSGFYQRDLNGIAPPQTQGQFLLKLNADYLYVAARTPIHPQGKQLRVSEKRPDNIEGVIQGDYMAVEILPVKSRNLATFGKAGSFSLLWNALGTLADIYVDTNLARTEIEWTSGAKLANSVSASSWDTELQLPLKSLLHKQAAALAAIPPKAGDYWSIGLARLFGSTGTGLFTTWVNHPLVTQKKDASEQTGLWLKRGMIKFYDDCVSVQIRDLGDLSKGELATDIAFFNPDSEDRSVSIDLFIQDSEGKKLWAESKTLLAKAGVLTVCPAMKQKVAYESRGSLLFIKIMQDDKILYLTPGLALLNFDDSLRAQFQRSLEILRETPEEQQNRQ